MEKKCAGESHKQMCSAKGNSTSYVARCDLQLNWHMAKSDCLQRNLTLVSILSAEAEALSKS